MRVFIIILVLIFSLQSWTKADDISDFEIEGMSIGDSALDFFTEEHIKSIRPGFGLAPKLLSKIIGKKVIQNVQRGTAVCNELIK